MWRYVADDCGSGGDRGPLAYLDAWDYCCSGTDPGAFADVDVAAEGRVGGDVDVVTDYTFVVYGGSCVDDAVVSDFCVRLDYRALHHDRSGTNGCIFRNNSGRMDRCGELRLSVRYQFIWDTPLSNVI